MIRVRWGWRIVHVDAGGGLRGWGPRPLVNLRQFNVATD